MPPPNITGALHMGHAMFTTLQDILIRYKRMTGHNTLWLPGCDHAGLATQEKLEQEMSSEGLDHHDGEIFDRFAAHYTDRLKHRITDQIRRTGASCDWSRYRFTLDKPYSKAVQKAFEICRERDMLFEQDDNLYLDMNDLAARLLSEIDAGRLKIIPAHEEKTLRHFLENIEPWCISRQIRWGHAIPDSADVLDTWFSSSLWPFAALGWPDRTDDLKTFYPAALIETADDILFFWCARMLMMGLLIMDELPFDTIYLHGIIRDKFGRKMSKSLGNGIDPIEIIDRFGCDSMRFALAENATPATDMRLYDEKFQAGKAMRTKLWNAAKFTLPHYRIGEITHPDDLEFIRKIKERISAIAGHLDDMSFHLASGEARKLLFDDFCSGFIEIAKERLYAGDHSAACGLSKGLDMMLRGLHPFMPFITEEIRGQYSDVMLIGDKFFS